jgi:hypothetical protein
MGRNYVCKEKWPLKIAEDDAVLPSFKSLAELRIYDLYAMNPQETLPCLARWGFVRLDFNFNF